MRRKTDTRSNFGSPDCNVFQTYGSGIVEERLSPSLKDECFEFDGPGGSRIISVILAVEILLGSNIVFRYISGADHH